MRDSLRWLVESVGLVAECHATAEAFLARYDPQRPGCLVVDVRLPGMSGVALQALLKKRRVAIPIIIITAYAEVSTAVRTLTEGAIDFIEKPFSDELLLDSIRRAIEIDRRSRAADAERARIQTLLSSLTRREHDILALVVKGRPSKVIARELAISEKTVEVHRARLMHKLKVDSTAELIRLVLLSESRSKRDPSGTP